MIKYFAVVVEASDFAWTFCSRYRRICFKITVRIDLQSSTRASLRSFRAASAIRWLLLANFRQWDLGKVLRRYRISSSGLTSRLRRLSKFSWSCSEWFKTWYKLTIRCTVNKNDMHELKWVDSEGFLKTKFCRFEAQWCPILEYYITYWSEWTTN